MFRHLVTAVLAASCLAASVSEVVGAEIKVTSEYYTAFLNISYVNKEGSKFVTERTETGRFSSGSVKEVAGVAVELVANVTVEADKSKDGDGQDAAAKKKTYELDYTGKTNY